MKLIVDNPTIALSSVILADFRSLYEEEFLDVDEREDFDTILARVGGNKQMEEPHSIILLYPDSESGDRAAGGMIADWYRKSRALHLIYIAVDPKRRQQKVATRLINDGIPAIKEWIYNNKNVAIQNIFFESNNPLTTNENKDKFDLVLRLKIFERLGARVFNIPYVQPPLDSSKKSVENLLLLTFASFNQEGDRVVAKDLILFLEDFYTGLGKNADDENLIGMRSAIDSSTDDEGFIVPDFLSEAHSYEFYNSSVTLHYADCKSYRLNPEKQVNSEYRNCNYFSSFEKDLMSYQNQENPPFTTCLYQFEENVEMIMPGCYCYTSEGVSHLRLVESVFLAVKLSLSVTCFKKTGCRICHLTVSPIKDHFFTELDLIRLGTFFGSLQENVVMNDEMKLKINGNAQTIIQFLASRYHDSEFDILHSGIVQIDLLGFKSHNSLDIHRFFEIFLAKRKTVLDAEMEIFAKTVCGIILGIFDFERMEDEEIFDTILPIVQNSHSFVVMHRGAVLKITDNNSLLQSIADSLIVSPYLLIPNVALSYNEFILNKAMQCTNAVFAEKSKTAKIEKLHHDLNYTLNVDFLRDLFQYPSEKRIIKYGNKQRGINTFYDRLSSQLSLLAGMIESKRHKRSNKSNAVVQSMLGVIATMQLYSGFKNTTEYAIFDFIFWGICAIVAVFIYNLIKN